MNKLPLYLGLLLLTQCSKCKDAPRPQPPTDPLALLPPETQTGQRTFGCLINGKPMRAELGVLTSGDWSCNNCLTISGQSSVNQPEYGMDLVLAGTLLNNQTFSLISTTNNANFSLNQFFSTANANQCYYSGRYIKSGRVELVKFDGVNRIAAGRFAFTLYEPGTCDTLRVTNGRFDIKF